MPVCNICPRGCAVDRTSVRGYCGEGDTVRVAKAYLHLWEEPCLCGESGSGTVFFSGCNLKCTFCQNSEISHGGAGYEITVHRLSEIFLELQSRGAANINLVTPTHFAPKIARAIEEARARGLSLPTVYNCGGYESVSTLRALEGLIDIYMPDFKYLSPTLSARYSGAEDYFDVAAEALDEMVRQHPDGVFTDAGMMTRGVIIRHMMLPGCLQDSRAVLSYLFRRYGNSVKYSIMSQYTPPKECVFPELSRKVTRDEYDELIEFAMSIGIENAYIQDGEAASESFIPNFDGDGVIKP